MGSMTLPYLQRNNWRLIYGRQLSADSGARVWIYRRCVRHLGSRLDSFSGSRQCANARDCSGDSNWRSSLFGAAIQDHRHRRCGFNGLNRYLSGRPQRCWLCGGRGTVRCLRLHWHEHLCARQCAHSTSCHQRYWPGTGRRFPRGCYHWHAGRWFGALGSHGFLLVSGGQWQPYARQESG